MDDNDDTLDDGFDDVAPIVDRKVLLLALGGLASVALILTVVRISRTPRSQLATQTIVDGDWVASLEHLAAAFEVRLQGIEGRLDDRVAEKVAHVAESHVAAVSLPPVALAGESSNGNGGASVTQPAPAGESVGVPPTPAAVSLPDA